ncbi:MAG: tryptophan synthase subunit alpha [Gemmatimonadota bacterium]
MRAGLPGPGLTAALTAARAGGRKLLIPFLTADYPDRARAAALLAGLGAAGADAIELGVPFSDPLADGPVIAAASEQALRGGATLAGAIQLGAERRAAAGPPLILFTYANPLAAYGLRRAAVACQEAAFGGVLVADLPFDEDPAFAQEFAARGLPVIRLAAPTTPPDRLRDLAAGAEGFLYLIARTGVTGAGGEADRRLAEQVAVLREASDVAVVIGFGIADADGARRAAALADGIIVGSALVARMGTDGPAAALDFVAGIRRALDAG